MTSKTKKEASSVINHHQDISYPLDYSFKGAYAFSGMTYDANQVILYMEQQIVLLTIKFYTDFLKEKPRKRDEKVIFRPAFTFIT